MSCESLVRMNLCVSGLWVADIDVFVEEGSSARSEERSRGSEALREGTGCTTKQHEAVCTCEGAKV